MRMFASLILGGVAALSIYLAAAMLMMLPARTAQDRVYAQEFRQAAHIADNYFRETGQLPDGPTFSRLVGGEGESLSLAASAGAECENFTKPENDRFVLSLWRGEWTECFSFPSGRTTLPLSWREQVLGFGPQFALFGLVAAGALSGVRQLWGNRPLANAA